MAVLRSSLGLLPGIGFALFDISVDQGRAGKIVEDHANSAGSTGTLRIARLNEFFEVPF